MITDYASLISFVGDTLNRADLATQIPQWIAFAEADFNRTLRTGDMVQRALAQISTQFTDLPSDYLENRYIQINDTRPYRLQYVTPQQMQDLRTTADDIADKPRNYTVVGLQIEVQPTPDTAYQAEIAYVQMVPPLSGGANWLIAKHPDLYLYSTLLHSAPYLRDDQRIPIWQAAHDLVMGGINEQEDRSRYMAGPLKVKMNAIGG